MKNFKSIIVLTAISLVVALALSVVNMFTAPIIEESANAAANGAYLVVLPDATNFSDVEGEFPPSVLEMKKDEGGTGFAFKLTATSSYSQSPLEMILGINNEGKITKLVITNYAETKGSAAEFEAFFEGKDAAVTDVIAGVTYSTNAIKTAIKEAYDAFYQFADIEKSDEQKLMDLYATVLPGGTGYITDIGMTGPVDSVIGTDAELVIEKMRTKMPVHFRPAEGRIEASGALFEIDTNKKQVIRVERVRF